MSLWGLVCRVPGRNPGLNGASAAESAVCAWLVSAISVVTIPS